LNSFIKQNLWDEARIFTSNKNINHPLSIDAPTPEGVITNTFKIGDNTLNIIENTCQ